MMISQALDDLRDIEEDLGRQINPWIPLLGHNIDEFIRDGYSSAQSLQKRYKLDVESVIKDYAGRMPTAKELEEVKGNSIHVIVDNYLIDPTKRIVSRLKKKTA